MEPQVEARQSKVTARWTFLSLHLYLRFHVTFVLILHFDWLQGPHIGQNFEKHSKIFFSETVKGMKPILCIHVPDSGLYIICVFYSRRIRTLVAMAT